MRVIEHRHQGYLVECGCPRGEPFLARRLSLTIECPRCGRTAPMADLVAAWVLPDDRQPPLEAAD